MWYVLQTTTGKEEELVQLIKEIVPSELYSDCFVAYYERVWRRQQESFVHVERLFPGYVSIISDVPKQLYMCLKNVPAMSKIIGDGGFNFIPLEEDEEVFFQKMLIDQRIVRLSYVELDGKSHIIRVSGPLKEYTSAIVRAQYKKRYVIIKIKMMGAYKTIALGVILKEDIQQEIRYGKIEAPTEMPEFYQIVQPEEGQAYRVGDQVSVISGAFENMSGVIWKIKKNTIEIGVRLFGQDMSMEVPIENTCLTSHKDDYVKLASGVHK